MFLENHLHVLIASDANYAEFVSTVCVSLFATNTNFEKISIHLLSNNIPQETINIIEHYIPQNGRGKLCVYDISNIYNMGLSFDKDKSGFSVTSYARLLSTKILPSDISRILYVDCDVIFNNDVREFWSIDLTDVWIAGVLDAHMNTLCKTELGLPEDYPYINAGVLLINLDEWRNVNIINKWQDVLDEYNGNVFHQDQGIINEACIGHIKLVHPKYNITSTYFSHPYKQIKKMNIFFYSKEEYEEAKNNPSIIHFTEGYLGRPWIEGTNHPYSYLFEKFHSKTIWKDSPLRKDGRPLPIKLLGWELKNCPYYVYELTSRILNNIVKLKHFIGA